MKKLLFCYFLLSSTLNWAQTDTQNSLEKGYRLAVQKKYDEAKKIFADTYTLDSNCARCLTFWAGCEAAQGNHQTAVAIYSKAIAKNDMQALSQRAESYYALEDMDNFCADAHLFLDAVHNIHKDSVFQEEVKNFKPMMKEVCDSNQFSYFMHRGIAASNLKNYEKALNTYQIGLKRFPDNPILLNYQGNTFLETKQFQAAADSYENALKNEKAITDYVKGKALYTTDTDVSSFVAVTYQSLAICYGELGNNAKAVEWIEKSEKRFPKSKDVKDTLTTVLGGIYGTKGAILMNLGRFAEAKTCFEQMLDRKARDPDGYFNYALCLLNESTQRIRIRRLSLNFSHSKNAIQNNLSFELPSEKVTIPAEVLETALFSINRAIKLSPKSGDYYLVRGIVRLQTDNIGLACLDFGMAKQLGNPQAVDYLKTHCKD
jgi:tetratricopeptide (TPR) repeat protein